MPSSAERDRLFRSWREEHRGIVVKVSRTFVDATADEADLEQELWLQLWTSLPSFANGAKPSTWIYRVCLNTALTWRRGQARRERRLDRDADVTALPGGGPSPADTAGSHELLAQLYAAIHALADFDRALILLLLDGLTYREIAEVTGLTDNHVGVALTRARRRLAARLKGVGDELE